MNQTLSMKNLRLLPRLGGGLGVSTSSEPFVTVDGKKMSPVPIDIPLLDDHREHDIVFEMV